MSESNHELIIAISERGQTDLVMDAARSGGARGGTVFNARGTGSKEAEAFFGITVEPEKEIVMILVSAADKDAVLQHLYDEVGLHTQGQGIAFSMPVDAAVGLSTPTDAQK